MKITKLFLSVISIFTLSINCETATKTTNRSPRNGLFTDLEVALLRILFLENKQNRQGQLYSTQIIKPLTESLGIAPLAAFSIVEDCNNKAGSNAIDFVECVENNIDFFLRNPELNGALKKECEKETTNK